MRGKGAGAAGRSPRMSHYVLLHMSHYVLLHMSQHVLLKSQASTA